MAAVDTAFSELQNVAIYPDGIERNFWHKARNSLVHHYLSKWRAEPLLEIGAGRGLILSYLLEKGWRVEGVDLTQTTPRWSHLPIRYGVDAFSLPASEREKYLSVALFDVLEHLPERIDFLRQIREKFPRVRYLYLTVPAGKALWSNYDEFCGHYLRYEFDSLTEDLEKAGYEVVYMRYFFHALYWIIWLALRWQKKRAEGFTPPSGLKAFLHGLIGGYFYAEARFLPARWRGSSLLAVARPRK